MSLAINYNFVFEGSKAELLERLASARDKIAKLDVQAVEELAEIPSTDISAGPTKADGLAFSLNISMNYYLHVHALRAGEVIKSDELSSSKDQNGAGFHVEVSDGCEPVTIFLGRVGHSQTWFGGGSTKTMGATDFIEAHEIVVAILKICQKAGILESVYDEAGLWEPTA
jgi:hypothetical protein